MGTTPSVLVVALAAVLVGCGVTNRQGPDVVAEPAEIVGTTENLTARVRVTVRPSPDRTDAAASPAPTITLDGVVDLSSRRFRLWRNDAGTRRWWEMIGDGSRVYTRVNNDAWVRRDRSDGEEAYGFDPWTLLDRVRSSDELVSLGSDDLRGVDARRYRFTSASDGAIHDVWVDGEGRVVRISTEPAEAGSDDGRVISIPGVEAGRTTIELWEFGIADAILALPADVSTER